RRQGADRRAGLRTACAETNAAAAMTAAARFATDRSEGIFSRGERGRPSVTAAGHLRRRIVRRGVLIHRLLGLGLLLLRGLLGLRAVGVLREGRGRDDRQREGAEKADLTKLAARGHECSPCW